MNLREVIIYVAIDPQGDYQAVGWPAESEKDLMDAAVDCVDEGEHVYRVRLELAVPETLPVQEAVPLSVERVHLPTEE